MSYESSSHTIAAAFATKSKSAVDTSADFDNVTNPSSETVPQTEALPENHKANQSASSSQYTLSTRKGPMDNFVTGEDFTPADDSCELEIVDENEEEGEEEKRQQASEAPRKRKGNLM